MSADLVGTVLDGKFEIERTLASGAAGDVYEAMHLGLSTRVAVKVLRPGIPETADIRRKRFMREARVAARLKSDNVVRIYDIVAPEQGRTYIVMELLQGETLADRVKRVGALPAAEAVDFVLQATRPLSEMHDEGIVHRDVKPSNLFLARDADGKERIKLLDFGVAAFQQPLSRADSSLTLSEAVVGTPRYMAPEQVQSSSRVDARADVWALGVTLYELIAGRPPFDGQTVLAVLNQIERQEPPSLPDTVPVAIASVVRDCLAKDPALRPANARALAERLAATTEAAPRRRDLRKLVAAGLGAAALASLVVVFVRRSADEPVRSEARSLASSSPSPAPLPSLSSLPAVPPPAALSPAPPSTSLLTTVSKDSSAPRRVAPHPPARGAPRPPPHPPSQDDDRIE
ncbi:MAG TPA: serine/threonine-protein kinase [Polyangiaceae bacterium]|jgi:serine/threonine-protein kinase